MTSWEELVDVAEMHLPHILGIIAIIVSNVISVIIVNIVIIVSIVSSLQKTLSPIEDTPPHQNIDWKRSRKGKQVGGQEMEMLLPEIKMTVQGTMVRSEVCNSLCFCLESYI